MKRMIAVLLVLCLALSGCGVLDLLFFYTPFEDMVYERPDMTRLKDTLQAIDQALEQDCTVSQLMDKIWDFYGFYYDFYTAYALSNIHYCTDMTDLYWQEEYEFCLEASTDVDAGLDGLLYTLAACPLVEELEDEEYFGPGFFDDYQGESLWDETFTALMAQEAQLQSQYYDLSAQALESSSYTEYYQVYGSQMVELFVELVALRQEIAAYAGFDSYPAFAYDFYYGRDFSPEQAASLLEEIRTGLRDLYIATAYSDVWSLMNQDSTEADTHAYVKNLADAVGGTVGEAFDFMVDMNLYDISYSENKYDASFTIFILNYEESYVFVNPTGGIYDQLTFTHEFGHFCNDYASGGSIVGIDVAEIFSQGLEYLSLCYGGEDLTRLKMADGLCVYVEQAAYADFENRVYALTGEDLTGENVCAAFAQSMEDFGLSVWGVDSRAFVGITHFFTSPLYVISYVVSNDAALQLYQLEQEQTGAGLALYQAQLDTEVGDFLAFLEDAGLESPFEDGHIDQVRDTLAAALG